MKNWSSQQLVSKTLKESALKSDYGATIIGIKQAGKKMVIAPGPDTLLSGNDILVLIGRSTELERLGADLA